MQPEISLFHSHPTVVPTQYHLYLCSSTSGHIYICTHTHYMYVCVYIYIYMHVYSFIVMYAITYHTSICINILTLDSCCSTLEDPDPRNRRRWRRTWKPLAALFERKRRCVCICMYIYIYIYVYIYIHTHIN